MCSGICFAVCFAPFYSGKKKNERSVSEICFGSVAKVEHPSRYLKLATQKKIQTNIIVDQRIRFCITSLVSLLFFHSTPSQQLSRSNTGGLLRGILPMPGSWDFAGTKLGYLSSLDLTMAWWSKGLELDFYHLNSARQTVSPSA